jgi:hypothetical protein
VAGRPRKNVFSYRKDYFPEMEKYYILVPAAFPKSGREVPIPDGMNLAERCDQPAICEGMTPIAPMEVETIRG